MIFTDIIVTLQVICKDLVIIGHLTNKRGILLYPNINEGYHMQLRIITPMEAIFEE